MGPNDSLKRTMKSTAIIRAPISTVPEKHDEAGPNWDPQDMAVGRSSRSCAVEFAFAVGNTKNLVDMSGLVRTPQGVEDATLRARRTMWASHAS